MKEQDLHIGCSYLATAGAIEKIITPTGRATLSAAFDYFSTGHLKGIPLTGEVLVDNLGFKKDKIDETYYFEDFEIMLPSFFKYKSSLLLKFQYVHQLQLLYFSLTGEFLPYKQ